MKKKLIGLVLGVFLVCGAVSFGCDLCCCCGDSHTGSKAARHTQYYHAANAYENESRLPVKDDSNLRATKGYESDFSETTYETFAPQPQHMLL